LPQISFDAAAFASFSPRPPLFPRRQLTLAASLTLPLFASIAFHFFADITFD